MPLEPRKTVACFRPPNISPRIFRKRRCMSSHALQLDHLPADPPRYVWPGLMGSIMPAVWSFQLALRARGLGSTFTTLHLRRGDEAARASWYSRRHHAGRPCAGCLHYRHRIQTRGTSAARRHHALGAMVIRLERMAASTGKTEGKGRGVECSVLSLSARPCCTRSSLFVALVVMPPMEGFGLHRSHARLYRRLKRATCVAALRLPLRVGLRFPSLID